MMNTIIKAKARAALAVLGKVEDTVGWTVQTAVTNVVHQEIALTAIFAVLGVTDLVLDGLRHQAEAVLAE